MKRAHLMRTMLWVTVVIWAGVLMTVSGASTSSGVLSRNGIPFDQQVQNNAGNMLGEGQRTFRFDTFGDEAFWGDTLKLHEAIEGSALGGVGPGISPHGALTFG